MVQGIGEILLWQRMSALKGLTRRALAAGLLLPVRGLPQSQIRADPNPTPIAPGPHPGRFHGPRLRGFLRLRTWFALRLKPRLRSVPSHIIAGRYYADWRQYQRLRLLVARWPRGFIPKATVVDRRGLADLGTFLRATGWRLIWGFNLGRAPVDQAVDEAVAVSASVGASSLAFEIGNEPDLFPGVHRPANYSYADYYAEYRRFKKAIREKLPNAPFAGPDVIVHADWLEQFAATEAADLKLLTYHYYAEGPPDNPSSTIENLLKPNAILPGLLGRLESTSRSSGVPYRICETNSCFGGGKPGVSDTMAAALWGLDFLFTLAQFNAAGVNMETGVNHLGFLSYYTPVTADAVRPLYYGMLAFSLATHGDRVQLALDNAGRNITAYAVRSDRGEIWLTLINKEAARDAQVRAECPGIGAAGALRLTAPSLSAKDDVLLGGSAVTKAGRWSPGRSELVKVRSAEMEIDVPAASAVLLRMY